MKMYSLHKKYSHLILADYGDDQFTLRIKDKGNTVTYTSLDFFSFFSFQSVSSFLIIYKFKTLLQKILL